MRFFRQASPFSFGFWRSRGFTQIEILIIVLVIGILAAIALPSFGGMLDAAKMRQTTAELRSAFQETQRSSIRQNKDCQMNVLISGNSEKNSTILGSCLSEGSRKLPQGIGLATNVIPESILESRSRPLREIPANLRVRQANVFRSVTCQVFPRLCSDTSTSNQSGESGSSSSGESSNRTESVQIGFGRLGAANFEIAERQSSSGVEANDNSAKFVSFRHSKVEGRKSCIVISRSLGLTRIGTYDGSSLTPSAITSEGQCKVNKWAEQ